MIEIKEFPARGSLNGPTRFLDALSANELQGFASRARRHLLRATSTLYHEGFEADCVMAIVKGSVKLSSYSLGGRESLIGIRGPSDLLALAALSLGVTHAHSAVALEDVELWAMDDGALHDYLAEHPSVRHVLIRTLSTELLEAESRVKEFACDSVDRVVRRLLELCARYGEEEDGCVWIPLPLTQEEFGSLAGCSREAVAKAFRSLRRRGWIATSRRNIAVLDLRGLRERAESI